MFKGLLGRFVPGILNPELGSNEKFVTRHITFFDRIANSMVDAFIQRAEKVYG